MSSHINLVPLEIRNDKKNYIVEDLVSGQFYEMPKVCIDAIHMIQNNTILEEIELQLKQKYPQEEVDLLDFANQLLELELVEEIDGTRIELKQLKHQNQGFNWISPATGNFFFNKFTMILYGCLLIANIALLIFQPHLFPHYKDLFIFNIMAFNIPAWMFLTFILVLIHEFGHILAIRAYNLPTRLEIGHRLFLVVFETDLSPAWKLSAKDRNRLYCAGLCFDILILFVAFAGQLIFSETVLINFLRIIVLFTFIRLVYQLCIYMKTDLYYVIENCTGCYNLMENARQLLKDYFKFIQKEPANSEVIFESERKTVFFYTIFYIIGVVLSISLYVIFYIPQLIYAFRKVLPGFQYPTTSLPFWDSAAFLIQVLVGLALLVYSWIKKYQESI